MPRSTAELLEELFTFLRIPSVSSGDGAPADLQAAAEWLAERLRAAGGEAQIVETARNPLVIGRISSGRANARRILVYGHYDVQTVHPLDAWQSPPFEPEIRDGRICARGASDDKGNMHCLLAAIADLATAGELPCDVTFVSDGEEEIGGDSVIHWLDADRDVYDAAIVFDGSQIEPGWPALTIGVRGVCTGRVTIRTGEADAHSGIYGGAALNAAHVLTRLLQSCVAVDGRVPAPLAEGAQAPTDEEIASWATLPSGRVELEHARMAPLDGRAVDEFYLRTLAWPTFDVNAITCRDASHIRTIIPCEATAAISLRLVPGQVPETIWTNLERHLRAHLPDGATMTIEATGMSGGCAFDPKLPALVAARQALATTFGHDCAVVRTGGAIPLVSALARRSVPTILSGVATTADNVHAPNESLAVADYEIGVRAARALVVALAEVPPNQASSTDAA